MLRNVSKKLKATVVKTVTEWTALLRPAKRDYAGLRKSILAFCTRVTDIENKNLHLSRGQPWATDSHFWEIKFPQN